MSVYSEPDPGMTLQLFFFKTDRASFVDLFLLFMFHFYLCFPALSVSCSLVIACCFGPLVCCIFLCFVNFSYGVLNQVWYLIVSIPICLFFLFILYCNLVYKCNMCKHMNPIHLRTFSVLVKLVATIYLLKLTLKTPITTAADDKFCDILPNFRKIRYDIS